jgi:hypothetical protein
VDVCWMNTKFKQISRLGRWSRHKQKLIKQEKSSRQFVYSDDSQF